MVGNEILIGKTRDTNTQYLIEILLENGIRLSRWTIVPDIKKEISIALRRYLKDGFDLIVVSGGMGPTHDDITVEAVSKGLGLPLERNEETLERMLDKWKRFYPDREMPPESARPMEKMSMLPKGSSPLHNDGGMAEGILVITEGSKVVVVPGVPREYRSVIGGYEFLRSLPEGEPDDNHIHEIGFRGGESQISEYLEKVQSQNTEIDIGSYPQGKRNVIIRITGSRHLMKKAIRQLEIKIREIERFNEMENG